MFGLHPHPHQSEPDGECSDAEVYKIERREEGDFSFAFDEDGDVKVCYDYYPFGLNMRQTIVSGDEAVYKFTGKERDDGSNYDYFGVRYYDSSIGRWMAPDPVFSDYSPYAYCYNNPLNFQDYKGFWPSSGDDDPDKTIIIERTSDALAGSDVNNNTSDRISFSIEFLTKGLETVSKTLYGQIYSHISNFGRSKSTKHYMDKTERAIGLSITTYHKTLMKPWTTRGLTVAGFVNPAFFIGATGVSIYQVPFKAYNAYQENTINAYTDFGFHLAGFFVGGIQPAKIFSPTGQIIQDLPTIYKLGKNNKLTVDYDSETLILLRFGNRR